MPEYIYGCTCGNRERVVHRMYAPVVVACGHCGEWMSRVPQLFTWGFAPWDVLKDKMDDGWRNYKAKQKGVKQHGRTN